MFPSNDKNTLAFVMIGELFSRIRVRQIQAAQAAYMKRILTDRHFATDRANWLYHAGLGNWIDKTSGTRVLEVGCGPGRYMAMLQTLGFQVTGIDPFSFSEWEMVRTYGESVF